MLNKKNWTDEEDQYLKDNWFEAMSQLGKKFNVSDSAIKFRLKRLGFERPKGKIANMRLRASIYRERNKDLYKIGITQNLLNRLNQLKPDEVLNTLRCSNYEELEKELHKIFKDDRIPQSEYFRLTATQVEEVHQLMTTKAKF
tara:strand:+ start:252 stop:680 length:429 start_codon:yes stop_codon:yes gene_type:complete